MTPRQFVALRARHVAQVKWDIEHKELMTGITTSTLANHSFAPPKKAYKPFDFMPSKLREKADAEGKAKPKRWTRQGLASQLRAMASAMPLHFIVKGERPKQVIITEDNEGNQTQTVREL